MRVRDATAWERTTKQEACIRLRSRITKGAGAGAASQRHLLWEIRCGRYWGIGCWIHGASVAAGALAGAIVGIGVAAVGVTADVTAFNNELLKQRQALANTVATSEELKLLPPSREQAMIS